MRVKAVSLILCGFGLGWGAAVMVLRPGYWAIWAGLAGLSSLLAAITFRRA